MFNTDFGLSETAAKFISNQLRIYENPSLPIFSEFYKKTLTLKPWMKGRAYHKRVQKKWKKRFGFTVSRYFVKDNNGNIFCHPQNKEALLRSLE